MNVSHNLISLLPGVIAMLSLSACNGLFDSIYDTPLADELASFGFVAVDHQTRTGRIYVDATQYTEWHYIDLHGKQTTTVSVGDAAPENWDFAIHRYDTKTHGAAVAESPADAFSSLPDIASIPENSFVADVWTTDRIATDMSQMMDGIIGYAEDWYNPCLSAWLDVDTSTMPPIYTLSGKVYLLRLSDGTCAALRLTNFMNDAAVKGFMSIEYLYPVQP